MVCRWRSKRGGAGQASHKVIPEPCDDSDSSLHRALYYQRSQLYGSGSSSGPAANGSARRHGDSLVGRQGMGSSTSYRWLEDAITEWQTSQGQLVIAHGAAADGGSGLGGYTPQQVEEVKLVLRLLPVFFTTVLYW